MSNSYPVQYAKDNSFTFISWKFINGGRLQNANLDFFLINCLFTAKCLKGIRIFSNFPGQVLWVSDPIRLTNVQTEALIWYEYRMALCLRHWNKIAW